MPRPRAGIDAALDHFASIGCTGTFRNRAKPAIGGIRHIAGRTRRRFISGRRLPAFTLYDVPLYDFRCRACGAQFEALVRGSSTPACPSCAGTDLERLLSGFSLSVRSGGLSAAARRAVQKQQNAQRRDQAAFQQEIEKKHLDD